MQLREVKVIHVRTLEVKVTNSRELRGLPA
jgi:hypothetical protein